MPSSALIVIDAQESFRHRKHWSETDLPGYLAQQQALVDGCVARGIPVVQVFHIGPGSFAVDSGHVRTLDGLSIAPDVIVRKHHHSAFAGTGLAAWLTARGIARLIVSGTSAGITAGIDMMLHLLAAWSGSRAASAVARNMVVYMRRAGADPQLSSWVSGRNHLHPALHRVQDALTADPVRPWSVDDMAGVACTSTRHLARLFHAHAGASPLDYLHRLRVEVARALLAQSALDMETVAERSGFGSARHLRRVWRKFDSATPSARRRAV